MRHIFLAYFPFCLVGCGGLVVLEEEGGLGGGATSSASATKASSVVSSSTGSTCEALTVALEQALDQTRVCGPALSIVQCDGSAILKDLCGCPTILANEHNVAQIQGAEQAYDAWVAAGCGPYPCETCTPLNQGGLCISLSDGTGRCDVNPD
jgi:hypothetical protein